MAFHAQAVQVHEGVLRVPVEWEPEHLCKVVQWGVAGQLQCLPIRIEQLLLTQVYGEHVLQALQHLRAAQPC